jgi:hypothetical protein
VPVDPLGIEIGLAVANVAERVHDFDGDLEALSEYLVEIQYLSAPARENHPIDVIDRRGGDEEIDGFLELCGEILGNAVEDAENLLQGVLSDSLPKLQALSIVA